MNRILEAPIALFAYLITRQFARKTEQPTALQERFLLSLLKTHQDTVFGREYDLQSIHRVEEFRERIPVFSYSDYQPYTERIARGEANVLTAEPVVYMNMTSGTTGKQKLIPVTRQAQRLRQQANFISICFALQSAWQNQRPLGKMLLTSSIQLLGETPGGIPYGPVSVGDLRAGNQLSRKILAHPYEALAIKDSLARHYVCLLFALRDANTKIIGANFPILALRLAQYLKNYGEALVDDLEQGTIGASSKLQGFNLEPELRDKLAKKFSPAPQRSQQLRQILQEKGHLTPILAWPNLSCIVTALGGTSNFYLQQFPEYFGNTPVFAGIYASAEGLFGIAHAFNNDSNILAIETGFFEFIPPQEWENPQPKTLLAEEVKVGEQYRILLTNYNGFYRYDIGDVVEVVGFYGKTPLITFRYRQGGLLSSTTEKTTEYHALQVMQRLQAQFQITLKGFCITLCDDELPPAYVVNIELSPHSTLKEPQQFLQAFDQQLKIIHASYEVKRRDQVPPPRLRILAAGSFSKVQQRLIEKGIPEHHLKFPILSEDRQLFANVPIEKEVLLFCKR